MAFIPGGSEIINETEVYQFKIDHRNNTAIKSQWILSCNIEYDIACQSIHNKFNIDNRYFNVLSNNLILQVVGNSILKDRYREPLIICKFIKCQNIFHGYPANHMMNQQDIPPDSVLVRMKSLNLLSDKDHKRISRGRPV